MNFKQKIASAIDKSGGMLCVGLDPDPKRLPGFLRGEDWGRVITFNQTVIDATYPYAAAYKLNLAFYEALGEHGWETLRETVSAIPDDCLTIADGKRGDIGNSARFYAASLFEELGFDAATVNPYMGRDSVEPFADSPENGAFILTLTSNPGAKDFQFSGEGRKLFEAVAVKADEWNELGNIGLVTGATQAEHFRRLREIAPDMPFLIPGIGAQGGDLHAVVENALKGFPGGGLINSSRGIIYASSDTDFAEAAGSAAKKLRDEINEILG